MRDNFINEMRNASGNVRITDDKLTDFIYVLLRDYLSAGEVCQIVEEIENQKNQDIFYTNGWLANCAKFLSDKLK